jgi:hypothetical protein
MGDLVRNANVPLSLYRSYDSGDLAEVPPEFTGPKWLAHPLEEDEATNQSGRVVRRYDIYLVSLWCNCAWNSASSGGLIVITAVALVRAAGVVADTDATAITSTTSRVRYSRNLAFHEPVAIARALPKFAMN